jgi:hypothetical protein
MTPSRILQWVCVATLLGCGHVSAATLEQVISREHPDLNLNGKFLGVGRDGNVYVGDFSGYVVRFNADGTGKWGGKTPMALKSVTANRDGVIATGHVHMSPAVRSWTPMFQEIANSRDFSNSDATGWNDPSAVEAGVSGDFYAADQCRNRIQRISPAGKVVDVYSLDSTGESYKSRYIRFRVIESLRRERRPPRAHLRRKEAVDDPSPSLRWLLLQSGRKL